MLGTVVRGWMTGNRVRLRRWLSYSAAGLVTVALMRRRSGRVLRRILRSRGGLTVRRSRRRVSVAAVSESRELGGLRLRWIELISAGVLIPLVIVLLTDDVPVRRWRRTIICGNVRCPPSTFCLWGVGQRVSRTWLPFSEVGCRWRLVIMVLSLLVR